MSEQKTAIITGASRRLGLYLSTALINEGYHVIALSRKASPALLRLAQSTLESQTNDSASLDVLELDYSDNGQIENTIKQIKTKYKNINLLVHNASLFEKDHIHKDNLSPFYDALYHVHMRLPALLNEGLEPLLNSSENANIIHISDIYIDKPQPDYALYCSTKSALDNLAKSYAMKWAPHIRVNSIQPGPLLFLPSHSSEDKNKVSKHTLLDCEPGFEPILRCITYIITNDFVTGSSHKVDGGRSLAY